MKIKDVLNLLQIMVKIGYNLLSYILNVVLTPNDCIFTENIGMVDDSEKLMGWQNQQAEKLKSCEMKDER